VEVWAGAASLVGDPSAMEQAPSTRHAQTRIWRYVIVGVLATAGTLVGIVALRMTSVDANPAAVAASRDLRADALAIQPYDDGRLIHFSVTQKSAFVSYTYEQVGIDDPAAARQHFRRELLRLGYTFAESSQSRTLVEDRFCKGTYEATVTSAVAQPSELAIALVWGDGVRCR
jgi:hypothetical protein